MNVIFLKLKGIKNIQKIIMINLAGHQIYHKGNKFNETVTAN